MRTRWPDVRVVLREDSGFARDEPMGPPTAQRSAPSKTTLGGSPREANKVDYALAVHSRLVD